MQSEEQRRLRDAIAEQEAQMKKAALELDAAQKREAELAEKIAAEKKAA